MQNFNYSTAGLAFTKGFEGCRLIAYQDAGGVWTIGYGHTGPVNGEPIVADMTIDANTAGALLQQDVQTAVAAVNRLVTFAIGQYQFDALVDFAYNCGIGNLAGSTLLKLVNAGHLHDAAAQFGLWVHNAGVVLPGLVWRRAAEAMMFLTGL